MSCSRLLVKEAASWPKNTTWYAVLTEHRSREQKEQGRTSVSIHNSNNRNSNNNNSGITKIEKTHWISFHQVDFGKYTQQLPSGFVSVEYLEWKTKTTKQ